MVLLPAYLFSACFALATNSSYVGLSNQIARKHQLGVVAHNAANNGTVGFEEDAVLFVEVNYGKDINKNSYVYPGGSYKISRAGALKVTNNPLDMAVAGDGFFKILTNNGPVFTLDGAFLINQNGTLVNQTGWPVLSAGGAIIQVDPAATEIMVNRAGTLHADGEEIANIGVFRCVEPKKMKRLGDTFYDCQDGDLLVQNRTIVSGALRSSNVNTTRTMAKLVELQRSYEMSSKLMSKIAGLEKATINRMTQNNK